MNQSVGRVLFVHQSPDLYGSDRVLLELATAVAQAGGAPIVVLPGEGPLLQALAERGIECHRVEPRQVLKLSRAVMTPAGALGLAASLGRALATLDRCVAGRRIELVHSNTLAVLAGALWARRRRVRHVWHVHEIVERPRAVAAVFPWLVQQLADEVLCNSHATRQWLLRARPALHGRTRVVWNGVPDVLAPGNAGTEHASLQADFRPAGSRLAIGLVGRINRMKGHHLLLAAAERLLERGVDDFSIVFIGSPAAGQEPLLAELKQCIAASPLRERVVLAGFMPQLQAAYAALDIVCVPSTEAEAFGLVAVEAMAAGRPVVAAHIGGLPEVVAAGRTGLLHSPGDADALADQLQTLLGDAGQRRAFGAAGRARYESEFTVATMNTRVLDLFALGTRPATRPAT